jgi:hypothetical protein
VRFCAAEVGGAAARAATVDLGRTELGMLVVTNMRARAARARARGAREKIYQPPSYRGKLLQHKLMRVQCTKKSTRVPVSPEPQYGYSV